MAKYYFRLRNGIKYSKVLYLPDVSKLFTVKSQTFNLAVEFPNSSFRWFHLKLWTVLQILCIHLKRFRHEVMFSSKINSYVSFPLEGLDMQPFLHKDCPSTVSTYDLVAVICHHGTAGG